MPNLLAKFCCAAIDMLGCDNALMCSILSARGLQKGRTMKKLKRRLKVKTNALVIIPSILQKKDNNVYVKPKERKNHYNTLQ